MGTFRIDEYQSAGQAAGVVIPCPDSDIITQTPITTSGTSQQSVAFASSTTIIELECDTAVHIKIGADPTATTDTKYLQAGLIRHFKVKAGDKVAVIDAS